MRRTTGILSGWCLGLVVALAWFHGLGSGELAAPPLAPAAWSAWLAGTDGLVATMAVLRLVVLAGGWYLLGVTVVGILARVVRSLRLIRLADALTVPLVRRLLQHALGAVLATSVVAGASAPAVAQQLHLPPGVAVSQLEDPGARGTASPLPVTGTLTGPAGDPVPILLPWERALAAGGDEQPDADAPDTDVPGATDAQVPEVAPDPTDAAPGERGHRVRPGDSLWRIAEEQLADVLGHAPSDAEVVPYWRALIERNRAALPVEGDADLILPGQELVLPAVVAP